MLVIALPQNQKLVSMRLENKFRIVYLSNTTQTWFIQEMRDQSEYANTQTCVHLARA